MNIITASPGHIPYIQDITAEVWPATYEHIIGKQQIAYMIDLFYAPAHLIEQMADGHRFLIGYDEAVPVAFASYSLVASETYKLHKLYIRLSMQGKGAGKAMLQHIINDIKQSDATVRLLLNVNRFNTPAIAFYKKMGFSVLHDEDIDIGSGYFMNDYVMYYDVVPR